MDTMYLEKNYHIRYEGGQGRPGFNLGGSPKTVLAGKDLQFVVHIVKYMVKSFFLIS